MFSSVKRHLPEQIDITWIVFVLNMMHCDENRLTLMH